MWFILKENEINFRYLIKYHPYYTIGKGYSVHHVILSQFNNV